MGEPGSLATDLRSSRSSGVWPAAKRRRHVKTEVVDEEEEEYDFLETTTLSASVPWIMKLCAGELRDELRYGCDETWLEEWHPLTKGLR